MKHKVLLLAWLCFSIVVCSSSWIFSTNSFFSDQTVIESNYIVATCAPPTTPALLSPEDGHVAFLNSEWDLNPVMDWDDSTSGCEDTPLAYQYQSYQDESLTQLVFQSSWLSDSHIPAPGTPDGTYFWRVRSKDQSGNTSEWSAPWLLTVDRSVPETEDEDEDVEEVQVSVPIVINEVYYDVASDKGTESKNEWIELYNLSESPISLKDWSLTSGAEVKIINSEVSIPALGFVLLSNAGNTWGFWSEPAGAVTINLGGNGEWLHNDGDILVLKDAVGAVIDEISWGTNETILNPAIPDVDEGNSVARSPLGSDTDSANDWQELTTPNPGTNPHSHILVTTTQEGNNLLISFENATGFTTVDYSVTYKHVVDGLVVEERISGDAIKQSTDSQLQLSPLFLGSCSAGLESCIDHTQVSDIQLELLYKENDLILGISQLLVDWNATHE